MKSDTPPAIGIDIGATTTRIALVDSGGGILDKRATPTPHHANARDQLGQWLVEHCAELAQRGARAIGVAVAGLADVDRKAVTRCVNIEYVEGDWLPRLLQEQTKLRVHLHTDIDAATWAEYTAHGRACRFAHLRIGTGVGLGVVIDDKLLPIEPGRSTHARALVVDERDDAPACPCGLRGCLEQTVGGPAVTAATESIGVSGGLRALQQAAEQADAPALALIDALADPVLLAIETLRRAYDIEVLALGGGVIDHLPAMGKCIERRTAERFARPPADPFHLARARLGDGAGVIGAACTGLEQVRCKRDESSYPSREL